MLVLTGLRLDHEAEFHDYQELPPFLLWRFLPCMFDPLPKFSFVLGSVMSYCFLPGGFVDFIHFGIL